MTYDFDDPRRFGACGQGMTVDVVSPSAATGRPAGMPRTHDERFQPVPPARQAQVLARVSRAPRRRKRPVTHMTYVIGIEAAPFVKIGYTGGRPEVRLRALQTGQPMQLSLLWSCSGDYEAALHTRFAAYRHRGEWFDLSSLGDPVEVVAAAVEEIRDGQR
ncbi:GIY-YIG nuclease family protein [Streptomyces tendae]|uniref:GIY-YIG nuclease family protein n=1 Tax=Streptomyces tendae TaxID=1932 RepID=UPI0036F5B60C